MFTNRYLKILDPLCALLFIFRVFIIDLVFGPVSAMKTGENTVDDNGKMHTITRDARRT